MNDPHFTPLDPARKGPDASEQNHADFLAGALPTSTASELARLHPSWMDELSAERRAEIVGYREQEPLREAATCAFERLDVEDAPPADDDVEIARLAALPLIEYEHERAGAAERMGIRASILDRLTAAARPHDDTEVGASVMFRELAPWPEPIDGARLLDDLAASAGRFIVLPAHGDTALALWTILTFLVDDIDIAPILGLSSPTKRCGKSTMLSWLARLVYRSLPASNITPAATFRTLEKFRPTLLIDEADSFLRDNEELRGVLNSGHTRDTAFVIRTVGDDHEPRRFCTWGAKAIALIGKLPDTLHDRAVVIEMRRRLPGEHVEKLRHADVSGFERLARQCRRWAQDHAADIRAACPDLPDTLNDRAADNWEPLLAIAEAAGADWPQRARSAALVLSGAEHDAPSITTELLADIRAAFRTTGTDRVSGAELVKILCADAERPWATYARGREITQKQLAYKLRGFGVISKPVRLPDGSRLKGYELNQFDDAFARYLPDTHSQIVTSLQPNNDAGFSGFLDRDSDNASRFENARKTASVLDCHGVTISNPLKGDIEGSRNQKDMEL